jgi:hypothetical protein
MQFISTHRIEMAKEKGAYMLLTQLPVLYLTSEKGLELMRESGEPMEFGRWCKHNRCGVVDACEFFTFLPQL